MANLIGMPRAAWRRQPTGNVDVDRLGIGQSLVIAYTGASVPNQLINHSGPVTNAQNSETVSTIYGKGLKMTGSNYINATSIKNQVSNIAKSCVGTLFALAFSNTVPSSFQDTLVSITSNESNPLFRICSSGATTPVGRWMFQRRNNSGTTSNLLAVGWPAIVASKIYSVCGVSLGNVANLYENGILIGTDTVANMADNADRLNFTVGAVIRNTTSLQWKGAIILAAAFDKPLSHGEVQELYYNPWQLFKPRIARFISIPSTGGVTFKPYWARSRSLILGSGV